MTEELRSLGSVRTRGVLLILFVAIAAGAAGGAIDRVWVARNAADRRSVTVQYALSPQDSAQRELRRGSVGVRTDRSLEERRPPGERGGIPISLRSLDLSADQRQRIEKISARFQPAAESLVFTIRDRVAALDLQMRQETMCLLTPKQRDDWIAWRRRERVIVEENNEMMKLVATNACPK